MLDITIDTNLRNTIAQVYPNEYTRIAQNLQFTRFAKVLPSNTLRQTYVTMLESAVIRDYGKDGGGVHFDEQVLGQFAYYNHVFKSGMKWSENKVQDLENGTIAGGISLITQWTKNITARAAYQPQHLAVQCLRNGEGTSFTTDNGNSFRIGCYDGLPLFHDAHPYNFKRTSLGSFSNLFSNDSTVFRFRPLAGPFKKNASTGVWEYDATVLVSPEDAFHNLWDVITQIASMKMADGITPRYLTPTTIVCGPRLRKMVTLITSAQFIAGSAGNGGGGSFDIKATVQALGIASPIFLDELIGLGTNEEYDWYLLCESDAAASELGAINITMREGWSLKLFTSAMVPELAISEKIKVVGKMRLGVGVGLPQFAFKNKAPRS